MDARAGTLLLLLALAAPVRADTPPRAASVQLARADGQLVADIALDALFSPPVENTLKSGLPVVIDLAVELRPASGASTGRVLRSTLSYDVWEDRYRLEREANAWELPDLAALEVASARFTAEPLAALAALPPGPLSLHLRVAVDPLGGVQRERMVRWLSRTVSDPTDPGARELRLDLGALIGSVFSKKGDDAGWGPELVQGPFRVAELPEIDSEEGP